MSKNFSTPETHAWEQWDWVWHTTAYALMILNLVIASNNDLKRGTIQQILVITILMAVWYMPFLLLPSNTWSRRILPSFSYFIIGWGIWMGLIYLHPASMMLAALFYPQVFLRLPFRWALAGSVILTGDAFIVGFLINSTPEMLPTLYLVAALLIVTQVIISSFINSLILQSNQRYQLLEELTQTRTDLLKVEREAGILAERQRLAREIHDTLAQDFTSIVMHLTAAQLHPSSSQTHIQQAEQTARDGLDESRRIVWALRPEQLEHSSLVESIERLVARFSAENSIRVENAITGTPRSLGPEKEAALLRVAQEALNNIKKHAQAQQVNITLSYMSDLIALDIFDDGIGFEEKNQSGYGLISMRERVEEFGGTLTIESTRNNGTAVAVSLPLENA
ncbi:MAG: sensor histidine kinase [Anaerolineales bacterium]